MRKVMFKILEPLLGKVQFYRLFKKMYVFSARAMNFGQSGDIGNKGELNFIKIIKNYYADAKNKIIVFDVGSNIGQYVNYCREYFGQDSLIHAFEPSPSTFKLLSENIDKLDASVVKINNIGLSDKNEVLKLYQATNKSHVVATIYERNSLTSGLQYIDYEEIVCETMDDYCKINKIEHIHLLKIDVEGHEIKVLNGGINMIRNKQIDFIQFEFGQTNIDSRTFFLDFVNLLGSNYNLFHQQKNGLYKVKYDVIYEVFNVTNYVAIRKGIDLASKQTVR